MKGVVLAGGTGSRLMPLTRVTNKHLLPVGREPMIFHPLKKLVQAGITEVCVVTGREHCGQFAELLGSGLELGCDLTYRVQDKAGGIAEALGLCEAFAGGDKLCVVLGDNVFEDELAPHVGKFLLEGRGAQVQLKAVLDPRRFGVAEIRAGKIVSIEEKPREPKSGLAVTGVYMYSSDVFALIGVLRPSERGELEITDVNRLFMEKDDLGWSMLEGDWTDAGTHETLVRAGDLVRRAEEA